MHRLTKHGIQRLRERLNIGKRSAHRQIELVLARGRLLQRNEYKKHAYLASISKNRIYYIHGEFIYVFRIEFNIRNFITVFPAGNRVLRTNAIHSTL